MAVAAPTPPTSSTACSRTRSRRAPCRALLLTPKGRVIAPLVVVQRGEEDFLLLTEPGLGEVVRSTLLRARFAAKCEIELEEHTSVVVFGGAGEGVPNEEYGEPAVELLDARPPADADPGRRARTPSDRGKDACAWGREIDDRVLPAEAGLTETHVSFTKGCYPGQEPIARLHYRGKANRRLRAARGRGRAGARSLHHARRQERGPDHELGAGAGARVRPHGRAG